MAERIERAGRRLGALMDDLLDLSRLERGELDVARSPTELAAVVHRLATERPDDDRLRLTVDLAGDLPAVLADAHRVHQVLTKLVDNAFKFSPDGTPVRIEGRRVDGHRVELVVVDSGHGIPAAELDRVFEPFFQLESPMTRLVGGMESPWATATQTFGRMVPSQAPTSAGPLTSSTLPWLA